MLNTLQVHWKSSLQFLFTLQRLGYKILKIHEVWHFSENQRKQGLFADDVNKWLKNKTEASGWPKNCTTEAAKSEYINAYYDREGVQQEPAKVAISFNIKRDAVQQKIEWNAQSVT